MDAQELKDIVGNPLALGDEVATDTMAYKSSNLRIGIIKAVEPGLHGTYIKVQYEVSGSKRTVTRRPSGVVKIVRKEAA